MLQWKEIKKWCEENEFKVRKVQKTNKYLWNEKEYDDLGEMVTDLWNKKTDNKWLDYKKKYKKTSSLKLNELMSKINKDKF